MKSPIAVDSGLPELALEAFIRASQECMRVLICDSAQTAHRDRICEEASLLNAEYVRTLIRTAG